MIGKTFDELSVGQSARFSKTISETDIYLYAGISGDFNPAHVNEEYAATTFFKTRIAHGMLTASFISTLVGTILPGPV
jgi:3-hydroxybutyryl-CoA dehydratase